LNPCGKEIPLIVSGMSVAILLPGFVSMLFSAFVHEQIAIDRAESN